MHCVVSYLDIAVVHLWLFTFTGFLLLASILRLLSTKKSLGKVLAITKFKCLYFFADHYLFSHTFNVLLFIHLFKKIIKSRYLAKYDPPVNNKCNIIYSAPCGRSLRSMHEVERFLDKTNSQLTADLFSFDSTLIINQEFRAEKVSAFL